MKNSLTHCCLTFILLLHNCQCISALIMSQLKSINVFTVTVMVTITITATVTGPIHEKMQFYEN